MRRWRLHEDEAAVWRARTVEELATRRKIAGKSLGFQSGGQRGIKENVVDAGEAEDEAVIRSGPMRCRPLL